MYFPYYGSKYMRGKYYPRPRHRLIIEPFAGSAGYATRYRHHDVRLYDLDETVIGTWRYLIRVRASELRSLPTDVDHLDDHPHLTQEQRWLIGWWLHKGTTAPRRKPSAWMVAGKSEGSYWGRAVRDRLAEQVESIRHWKAEVRSYDQIPDGPATWFIDPPYQSKVGDYYTHRFKDHYRLGEWCRSRSGQVIVCEHRGANWLPFRPLGPTGPRNRKEMVWVGEMG